MKKVLRIVCALVIASANMPAGAAAVPQPPRQSIVTLEQSSRTGMSPNSGKGWPATVPLDFSSAGYAGGGVEPPIVPARLRVAPLGHGSDDTSVLQAALDAVGRLAPDEQGWRGTVALDPGIFRIAGQLRLGASGVVLRGGGSTLLATGRSRRALIEVFGADDRSLGAGQRVTDTTAPAGVVNLTLADVFGLAPGMRVVVRRPCTAEWIAALGMDQFKTAFASLRVNWLPGSRDLEWERTLTAVDQGGRTITLDAPSPPRSRNVTAAVPSGSPPTKPGCCGCRRRPRHNIIDCRPRPCERFADNRVSCSHQFSHQ